jgi:ribosomal protein S1
MRRKKYSYFEYEEKERETMENVYSKTFPEDLPKDFSGKDLGADSSVTVKITKFSSESGLALGETLFGQSIIIDTKKEEKSLRKLGYPLIEMQEGQVLDVVIHKEPSGAFTGSVSAGYEKALKQELHQSIVKENCAYRVKVKSVCNGGFMVDLSGIECFLPGSLAAANRIINFADYVGKEINVMVEIYDQRRDIFVVSFKKYLKKIIDTEVQNLSFADKYDGVVTGSSNIGVFVEWDEIFTGIIPFEDTTKESLEKLKPGDTLSFYVVDIKNPQRVVLSITQPNEKLKNIQELKDASEDVLGEDANLKIYQGEITKLKTFGVFVKLENGLSGLIEKERLANPVKDYSVGQSIDCSVISVDVSSLKVQLVEVE